MFPQDFTVRVKGVTFADGYPENLHRLQRAFEDHLPPHQRCDCKLPAACRVCRGTGRVGGGRPMWAGFGPNEAEPLPVVLIRNPTNPHDSNAIEVHVPAIGQMIGHVDRGLAATLAPMMDAGWSYRAGVGSVLVSEGHEDRPGITIVVQEAPQQ